jgi:NAD+ synthase (glutamine-hydrolysing)
MKIAICQTNTLVGDLKGNADKILSFAKTAKEQGADIAIFPELTITGYPPGDLLDKKHFIKNNLIELERVVKDISIPAVLGFVNDIKDTPGKDLFNSAAFIEKGKVIAVHNKCLLPTYDVFDEARYFNFDNKVGTFSFMRKKFALTICEDLWNQTFDIEERLYSLNPVDCLVEIKPDFVINIAASPYGKNKKNIREKMLSAISKKVGCPVVYVNQIGGQDELIFDGHSFVSTNGEIIYSCPGFKEGIFIYDTEKTYSNYISYSCNEEEVLNALVLGLRDYLSKCGFKKVVLGLSGGIDSALVAAIASLAIGKENVKGILMPSKFSSAHSVDDALSLVNKLGINHEIIPIKDIYESYISTLKESFKNKDFDVTEENIQARIRGNIIMAFSNKFNMLALSTGNKSEVACGYCTLYGDMSGGLSVIADIYKTKVYKLAKYINKDEEIIPYSTINKAPSAELRLDQKDSDSLPEYDILDDILKLYIEETLSATEIIKKGFDEAVVKRIIRLVDLNEYKRRQAAPALKVSLKAFGIGRRMPIAQGYRN